MMDWVLSLIITISLALPFTGRCSHVYTRSDFPKDFAFGSGNLDNGDIACDGYHKYKEDVQLMVETGLDAFKLSISWSRLIPNGRGPVNPKGLQFYKSFIQELVTHGIEPHVTLHHYDLPQALQDDYGGWLNRTIIEDFTAYADVCFREFGSHVKFWTTINEANIFTIGSYNDGITGPGRCSGNCMSGNSSTEPYIVGHNLLLAHASASRLYRQKYKNMQGGSVALSLYAIGFSPATSSKDDEMAAQRARDFYLGWMLEPLVYGDYPYVMRRTVGSRLPNFSEEESELVKGSSDFIGIIHYLAANVTNTKPYFPGYSDFYSDCGITLSSKSMKGDFQMQQKDTPRIEYLHVYIGAVLNAVRNGSDTKGYFIWSFMDVYELLGGYGPKYGLYYVNFSDTHLRRLPKLSAHWYSAFLKGDTILLGSQGITQLQSNLSSSSLVM
uniref:thioglucosidase n=1 Tax=Brassica oleracea var. oleracea TaxID=109376 RepID=A0A0D3B2T2_BRAOL